MANKSLFASVAGILVPRTNTHNHSGSYAYSMSAEHKLAQLAATGTLSQTFYASAEQHLDEVLKAAYEVSPEFVAKTALFARERGFMKDMPALLLAWLSSLQNEHFTGIFDRVVDNGKMLRTFTQIMRSGAAGRKSLGTRPKKMIQNWLETASDMDIMRTAVGQNPSLADIIKMVHPKPKSKAREALFGYLIGRPYDVAAIPEIVREFEAFKQDPKRPVPKVPFQMLTALPLKKEHWIAIGETAGWHMIRMNLNTFARHNAFEDKGFVRMIAEKIRDPEAIRKAKVFPYQLMMAYGAAGKDIPVLIREALQDAMETAIANVPEIPGNVAVCVDVSGSMSSPVTGYRKGQTSSVRCVDVAALVAAAVLRRNPHAVILPFENKVRSVDLNTRDSVMTNAHKLAALCGGGTNCSAPILELQRKKASVDLVIMVSDNESWIDASHGGRRGTGLMQEWEKLKKTNPQAKLVCLDIQPYTTFQAVERNDILNIGGFSDAVFDILKAFADGTLNAKHWVGEIEKIDLATS